MGPTAPINQLPDNFRFIKADVKPAQCYEIAIRAAQGVLVHWTADDANYNHPGLNCPDLLDMVWEEYVGRDPKTILAISTFEDGSNVSEDHRFFFGKKETPCMAPFGFMNREWLMGLGGYDRNFICGQSENDVVMRALADGGRVELLKAAKVYVHHAQCHGDYPFRNGYNADRAFLESCWVNADGTISKTRLKAFQPFGDYEIDTVNQGPAGQWEKALV